jgi:DME family drug/metabolite transporter
VGGRRVRTGFLLLVVTGLIWGTVGIAARLVFDRTDLDAMELSWLRTMFAAPACLLIGLRLLGRRLFDIKARDVLWVAGLAISIFVFQVLYLIGVREIGVTVATLICLCSIPVLVATASIPIFGERPSRPVKIALVGAVAGTSLLTLGKGASGGDGSLAMGIAASLASAAGGAAYTLGSRAFVQRYSPITALALGFPITLVILAPVMRGGHVNSDIPVSAWLLLIYLGVGTQGLAYLFFQQGLRSETATVASIVTLVEPVLAAVLAWAIFSERLGALGVIGAGLLIAGLMVLSFAPRPGSIEGS